MQRISRVRLIPQRTFAESRFTGQEITYCVHRIRTSTTSPKALAYTCILWLVAVAVSDDGTVGVPVGTVFFGGRGWKGIPRGNS